MSSLTIFLAKFLGLYCIVVALTMMIRKQSTIAAIQALLNDPPLLLFVEVLGLAAGLAMIVGHNIWSGGALPVVISLFGWVLAIRGAGLLALSPAALSKLVEALRYEELFYFYVAATLVLGLYLTYAGFDA
jgi:hypothetical protein